MQFNKQNNPNVKSYTVYNNSLKGKKPNEQTTYIQSTLLFFRHGCPNVVGYGYFPYATFWNIKIQWYEMWHLESQCKIIIIIIK